MKNIQLIKGDITQQQVDAIVNAANTSLQGGGGVDGAIHKAAGPMLLEECRTLNGCKTGEAKITAGYMLNATYVIHAVGPVWHGGHYREKELLKSCYINAMNLAVKKNLKSIAIPNISTGAFNFPKDLAGQIAIDTVIAYLQENDFLEVVFVANDQENYDIYQGLLSDFTA